MKKKLEEKLISQSKSALRGGSLSSVSKSKGRIAQLVEHRSPKP